jgi:hypothetical protein
LSPTCPIHPGAPWRTHVWLLGGPRVHPSARVNHSRPAVYATSDAVPLVILITPAPVVSVVWQTARSDRIVQDAPNPVRDRRSAGGMSGPIVLL